MSYFSVIFPQCRAFCWVYTKIVGPGPSRKYAQRVILGPSFTGFYYVHALIILAIAHIVLVVKPRLPFVWHHQKTGSLPIDSVLPHCGLRVPTVVIRCPLTRLQKGRERRRCVGARRERQQRRRCDLRQPFCDLLIKRGLHTAQDVSMPEAVGRNRNDSPSGTLPPLPRTSEACCRAPSR